MKRITFAMIAAGGIAALASPTNAELANWYHCSHPEWQAAFGYNVIMVEGSVLSQLGQGPGVTCNLLDIDYESSKGRACYLAWQFPSNNWAVYDPRDKNLSPLVCG